ncbi:substrate-binding domain-containing protein [Aestuariimicrobium sp. T2.26MG-19.2B]|uniref:substrate-binding domain-containing protein n=1 Tax=Aestuariimicrobium sp. T2.26MG-19.2B TaxID=3040679 RepID=UPI00247787C4|nr:substrate-binding domain-containing protein [Aestuariimicrobium sp. T2.26MG-19.2B]CAI9411198.1 hypothetical protein AESSP_02600 [Aestuariimicrobium sp. T2.26MG-19.2B]
MKRSVGVWAGALALATTLVLGGCANKADAESVTVDFARAGAVETLVLAPSTPGHPALRPFLRSAYAAAGLDLDVTQVRNTADLRTRVRDLEDHPPPTLVVELPHSDQPADELAAVVKAGASVLCLGERPQVSTGMCSVFVGWDDWAGGFNQAAALTAALGQTEGRRWNVESLGLAPDDKAGAARLRGTFVQRLPYRSDSPTITKTGRLYYTQVEVPDLDPGRATEQLSTTIQATYLNQPMDGLLLPTDDFIAPARAAFELNRRPLPLMVSAGATPAGLKALADGIVVATEYRDPKLLAHQAALTLSTVRSGRPVVTSPRRDWENGFGEIPVVFITPVSVTLANAATTLADAPEMLAHLQ